VNKTDYINASLVEVKDVDRRYILTQGPLSNTVAHFWALVWEQVSLTPYSLTQGPLSNTVAHFWALVWE
jgi:protein tyrosine phosphatase